jgi:hypothetical protein
MDLKTITEYINIHKVSMEQDLETIKNSGRWANDRVALEGAINVSNHYLEYINER